MNNFKFGDKVVVTIEGFYKGTIGYVTEYENNGDQGNLYRVQLVGADGVSETFWDVQLELIEPAFKWSN